MTLKRRMLPLLERIRIASPCDVPWAEMRGDDQIRHCDQCDKNVYDLSALTRDQAEQLLDAHTGDLCITYFRRADGTVLLADCPVGEQRRRRWVPFSALAVGTLAGVAGLFALTATTAEVTPEPAPSDNTLAAVRRQDATEPMSCENTQGAMRRPDVAEPLAMTSGPSVTPTAKVIAPVTPTAPVAPNGTYIRVGGTPPPTLKGDLDNPWAVTPSLP